MVTYYIDNKKYFDEISTYTAYSVLLSYALN